MTPKQKALELVDKFSEHARYWDCYNDVPLEEQHSVKCAIIAVDEIIEAVKDVSYNEIYLDDRYWKKVKQELEKMEGIDV